MGGADNSAVLSVVQTKGPTSSPDLNLGQVALAAPGHARRIPVIVCRGAENVRPRHPFPVQLVATVEGPVGPHGPVFRRPLRRSEERSNIRPQSDVRRRCSGEGVAALGLPIPVDRAGIQGRELCATVLRLLGPQPQDLVSSSVDPGRQIDSALGPFQGKRHIKGIAKAAPLLLGNYGSDYWVRTGASLLGIWANTTEEVIYFVGTRDADGELLNGTNSYVLHFPAGTGPDAVVDGYWSVILVDVPNYRVVPNSLDRFNFNSYSPLERDSDGALRILIATEPSQDIPATNWLPSPAGDTFSLTIRLYLPKQVVARGDWFPPALKRTA